jgi:hypothetical protein
MSEMDIKAQVSLYTQGYESGLAKIRSENQSFVSSLSGISPMIVTAFAGGAVLAMANSVMANAHSLETSSKNMHVNIESLQALRAAAKEAGVEENGLDMALTRVIKAQSAAVDGDKKMADAFGKLNISFADLKSLSPDQLLAAIGKGLVTTGNSAAATHASFEILGRSTSQFTGLLETLGTTGLDATIAKMKELGMVIDEADIKQAALDEKIKERGMFRLKSWATSLVAGVTAGYEDIFKLVSGMIGGKSLNEISKDILGGEGEGKKAPGAIEDEATNSPAYEAWYKAKEKLWFSQLSTEKKITETIKERNSLMKDMGTGDEYYTNAAKVAELDEKILNLKKQQGKEQEEINKKDEEHMDKIVKLYDEQDKIAEDYKKGMAHLGDMKIAPLMTDSLAKMGGYVGGQVNPQMRVAEKALQVAEKAVELHREANVKLQKIQDEIYALQG